MIALTKISETSSKITLGWTPVPGAIGYRFQSSAQAPKWSHTWDGNRSQVTFSKADWYKVEALGVEDAGEYPVDDPEPPVGNPIPASGRITQGGVYSGNYTGSTIVIDTSALVTISQAVITNTSGDMFRGLGGGFTIKNLVLDHVHGICQNAGVGQGRRIFDADGPVESITVRSCTFERATGMKLSGQMNADILIEKTKLLNPMGDPDNTNSQFLQLNAVTGARVEVGWCECICTDTNSFTEDIISVSGNGAYIHDVCLDGQWTPGNREGSSQGGITLEEGASNSRIEDCFLIATTGGVTLNYNIGPGNVALRNRVVRSGYLPDGVTRILVGYSGMVSFPGSPGRGPQNGNHSHGNVIGFMLGSKYGTGRMDWEDDDLPPDCLPTNTHLAPVGGAVTPAHEDAERARWKQRLQDNGITVGA